MAAAPTMGLAEPPINLANLRTTVSKFGHRFRLKSTKHRPISAEFRAPGNSSKDAAKRNFPECLENLPNFVPMAPPVESNVAIILEHVVHHVFHIV